MGLLSWFSPTPEKRIARAEKFILSGRFADARDEVSGLDSEKAKGLFVEAERGLTQANLEAARSWADAGDDERVERHLELAARFHKGGLEDEFKQVRRYVRELRQARKNEADEYQRKQEAKLLDYEAPAFLKDAPVPNLPDGLTEDELMHAQMRISLVLENYPKSLQATVPALGPDYAQALLLIEDGKAEESLQTLLKMDSSQPLVRYERARSAFILGDAAAARDELNAFGRLASGHQFMGSRHSAEFLAQMTAEAGDIPAAIKILMKLRETESKHGGFLLAQLLFADEKYPQAETVLRDLIRSFPRQTALYKLLAQVRIAAGFRIEAMRVLEQALEATHCAPGTCGYQPPDPEVKRLLAILYLEDNIEHVRAQELISELPDTETPLWDDVYLKALNAKRNGDGTADSLTRTLLANTPETHPAHTRAQTYLLGG